MTVPLAIPGFCVELTQEKTSLRMRSHRNEMACSASRRVLGQKKELPRGALRKSSRFETVVYCVPSGLLGEFVVPVEREGLVFERIPGLAQLQDTLGSLSVFWPSW